MITVWFFDSDVIGHTPQHIYTGASADDAIEALMDRFGFHLFDAYSEAQAIERGSYVIELPNEARVAVIVH